MRVEQLERRELLANGADVVTDVFGNIYLAGNFDSYEQFSDNWLDFDPGPGEAWVSTVAQNNDAFLAKYSADRSLIWVKTFSGLSGQFVREGLALDDAGSLYLAASFGGTVDFAGWTANTTGSSLMLAKLNAATGELLWAEKVGENEFSTFGLGNSSMALDGAGRIYTYGGLRGTCDVDPSPEGVWELTSQGEQDQYVASFNAEDGHLLWARQLGSPTSSLWGGDLTADDTGVYVMGAFQGTISLPPVVLDDVDPAYVDAFLIKFNADGTASWGKQWTDFSSGGAITTGDDALYVVKNNDYDSSVVEKYATSGELIWSRPWEERTRACDIVCSGGSLYVTGTFDINTDFDLDPIGEYFLDTPGGYDVFAWKMTTDGEFIWARKLSCEYSAGAGIAVDNATGSVLVTGRLSGEGDFDPGAGTAVIQAWERDVFVWRLSNAGDYRWAFTIGTPQAVVDDGDSGYAESGKGWKSWQNVGYQRDSRYHPAGTGTNTAQWTFDLPAGQYQVYATWTPSTKNATNAQYTVNGRVAPLMNQRIAPDDLEGVWESLGLYSTDALGQFKAVLSDKADGKVIADAVQVRFRSPLGISLAGSDLAVALTPETNDFTSHLADAAILELQRTPVNLRSTALQKEEGYVKGLMLWLEDGNES